MASRLTGKIKGAKPNFCFIQGDDGKEYYLGKPDMQGRTFTVGTVITFTSSVGPKGLNAHNVQVESGTSEVKSKGKGKGKAKGKTQGDVQAQPSQQQGKSSDDIPVNASDVQDQGDGTSNDFASDDGKQSPEPGLKDEPGADPSTKDVDGTAEVSPSPQSPTEVDGSAAVNEAPSPAADVPAAEVAAPTKQVEDSAVVNEAPSPAADVPAAEVAAPTEQAVANHKVPDIAPPEVDVPAKPAAAPTENKQEEPATTEHLAPKAEAPAGAAPAEPKSLNPAGAVKSESKPNETLKEIPPAPAQEAGCCTIS